MPGPFGVEAVVLRTEPYRSSGLLVWFLDPEDGVWRGVLRRLGRRQAPSIKAALQLLSVVHVTGYRGRSDLATVDEVSIVESSYAIAPNPVLVAVASSFCELILVFCPEGEPAEKQFALAKVVLRALQKGVPPEAVLAYQLYWVLRLSGLMPRLDRCSFCSGTLSGFPYVGPGPRHPACARCSLPASYRLTPQDVAFLAETRKKSPEELSSVPTRRLISWLAHLAVYEAGKPFPATRFALSELGVSNL